MPDFRLAKLKISDFLSEFGERNADFKDYLRAVISNDVKIVWSFK